MKLDNLARTSNDVGGGVRFHPVLWEMIVPNTCSIHRQLDSRSIPASAAVVLACLVVASVIQAPALVWAEQKRVMPTYEQMRPPFRKGVFFKDNNVWVYTSDFAKKFGMPTGWVDDTLQGAEAVAYRVDWGNRRSCANVDGATVCSANATCTLDLYIPKTADITIHSDLPRFNRFHAYEDSFQLLKPQSEEDDLHIHELAGEGKSPLFPVVTWITQTPVKEKRKVRMETETHPGGLNKYDTGMFLQLNFYAVWVDCGFPLDDSALSQETWFGLPGIEASAFMDAKPPVRHRVIYPHGFLQRVLEHRKQVYAPKSQDTERINRLRDDGLHGRRP